MEQYKNYLFKYLWSPLMDEKLSQKDHINKKYTKGTNK